MPLKLSWLPDLQAEAALTRIGIGYTEEEVPFSKIDLKESQVNGARIAAPLLPDVIEDYANALAAGDAFPKIVVTKIPSGYLILWGNQRTAAIASLIKAGKLPKNVKLPAYVTEPLDQLYREVVARSGNVTHGARASQNERLLHAIHCVQALGMNPGEAARAFNVTRQLIQRHIKVEETRRELQRAGLPHMERLQTNSLYKISQLDFDEKSQHRVAHLVAQHGPASERVSMLVNALKSAKTEQCRLKLVQEFERELTTAARAAKPGKNGRARPTLDRPRRREFLAILTRLVRFLEQGNGGEAFTNAGQLQLVGEEDLAAAKSLAGKAAYRLKVLNL